MDGYRRIAECIVDDDEELARDLIGVMHPILGGSPRIDSPTRRRLRILQEALRAALISNRNR